VATAKALDIVRVSAADLSGSSDSIWSSQTVLGTRAVASDHVRNLEPTQADILPILIDLIRRRAQKQETLDGKTAILLEKGTQFKVLADRLPIETDPEKRNDILRQIQRVGGELNTLHGEIHVLTDEIQVLSVEIARRLATLPPLDGETGRVR